MRESGILMPVSSLPGPFGIGTLGKGAYDFVDFLARAGQHVWQILPLSPTGFGDSPYQSCSAFAGSPLFIDFEPLRRRGLLKKQEYAGLSFGKMPRAVDYDAVREYHRSRGWVCFENRDMGLYFINDPDDYWIEILPLK